MRILHVLFSSSLGGAKSIALSICEGLNSENTLAYCSFQGGNISEYLNKINVEKYLLKKINIFKLKKLANKYRILDDVIFIGGIPHNNVLDLLDETDIYIQPSLTVGLGRSVVEALSRGCFCLGSSVGGISELIEPEFRFKAKDYKRLADLILNYINLPLDKRIDLSICAFTKAKNYNLKVSMPM